MALVIFDKKHGPLVRVRCPNCGSRNPLVKSGLDEITVHFPTCGAFEKVEDGKITATVPCRIKS